MSLHSLPNELLSECFAYLSKSKTDIFNLRLVSKTFYAASSAFLIHKAKICFTSDSFRNLERLAQHPIFSRNIQTVVINVSYYDELLAHSLARFAEHSACELGQTLEWMERSTAADTDNEWKREKLSEARKVSDAWYHIGSQPDFDPIIDPILILLTDAHEKYVESYNDQETLMEHGKHIKRMTAAFEKFTALKSIVIEDQSRRPGPKYSGSISFLDRLAKENYWNRCLTTSRWQGGFRTARDTQPPVHIIPDLFTGLAETSIRPKQFEIKISAPYNLRCMYMSETQLEAISKTLSHAKECYVWIQGWARRDSLAENNHRPQDEMEPLCKLTSAFFRSPYLKEIHLSLDDYPSFGTEAITAISLTDLIHLPLPSSNLSRIYFRNVPFKLEELHQLSWQIQHTLEWFNLYCPYLLSGSWEEALDLLRNLESLEYIELQYMNGGGFGPMGILGVKNLPEDELIEAYVLRKSEQNPFTGWVAEEDD